MTEKHLGPEVIAQVASGALAGTYRAAALAHVEGCDACRADLTYLVRFERRRRRRTLAIAGGLGMAALAVLVMPSAPVLQVDPQTVRGGDEGIPRVASYRPANRSVVEGDSIEFSWQGMGAGAQYTFLLSTATGQPVLERASRDSTLYLGTSDLLEPGGEYLWLVDALLADGTAATSAVWRFSVRE